MFLHLPSSHVCAWDCSQQAGSPPSVALPQRVSGRLHLYKMSFLPDLGRAGPPGRGKCLGALLLGPVLLALSCPTLRELGEASAVVSPSCSWGLRLGASAPPRLHDGGLWRGPAPGVRLWPAGSRGPIPSAASRGESPGAGGRPHPPLLGRWRQAWCWSGRQSLMVAGEYGSEVNREGASMWVGSTAQQQRGSSGVFLPCRSKKGARLRCRRPQSSCGSLFVKSLKKESEIAYCFQNLSAACCSSTAPEVLAARHLVTGRNPRLFCLQRARIKKCWFVMVCWCTYRSCVLAF